MNCDHANAALEPGNFEECEDCRAYVWRHDQNTVYLVPDMRPVTDGVELHPATNMNETTWFQSRTVVRTRLNIMLDGLVPEEGLPTSVNSVNQRNARMQAITEALAPYGLVATRFVDEGNLEKNEPFWIHRVDEDPRSRFPELHEGQPPLQEEESVDDPRWEAEWRGKIEQGPAFDPYRIHRLWRRGQREAVTSVLKVQNSLSIVSLPTGRGKSFIAQYCAQLLRHTLSEEGDRGPTLIISPLISLMDDQRLRWSQMNVEWQQAGLQELRCAFLTAEEQERPEELKRRLREGELDVLCCSPEALLRPKKGRVQWIEIFQKMTMPFSLMVVDEAHTIADWGASIRPEFQLLNTIKRILVRKNPACRLLLMSATITAQEEEELKRMFSDGMALMETIRESGQGGEGQRSSNTRPDLMFDIDAVQAPNEVEVQAALAASTIQFQRLKDEFSAKQEWWRKGSGEPYNPTPFSAVLFTRRRKDAMKPTRNGSSAIHDNLTGRVLTYTGSTSSLDRQNHLDDFLNDTISHLVATSAFGMGVDKPNAWMVGYLGLPFTLKGLYQSFGRAARDSDWSREVRNYRSGLCFGRIFGRRQSFSPEMQLKLSLERYWDFIEANAHGAGYMYLDIEHDSGLGWTTSSEQPPTSDFEFEEDALQDEYGWASQMALAEERARRRAEIEWRKRRKSLDAQIHFRMWLLSVLERAEVCSIAGMLRSGRQLDAFRREIQDGVTERNAFATATQELGHPPEPLVLVVRMNKDVGGFDHAVQSIERGIQILKERHDEGLNEIQAFREALNDPDACRRQLLAPAVGVRREDELSCIEAFARGVFLMPCNACRRDSVYTDLGLPEQGLLVSTQEIVELLKHRQEIPPAPPVSAYIMPRAGCYVVGESIELIEGTSWGEGQATLIDPDGVRIEVIVDQGGASILLHQLGQNSHWDVPDGRGYVEGPNGMFVSMGDE